MSLDLATAEDAILEAIDAIRPALQSDGGDIVYQGLDPDGVVHVELVGALLAIIAVFALPPVYRSSALMLVQSPQLSNDVVGNAGDTIERRMARIKEQVTSRPDLIALIDEHGLYRSKRARVPLSKIISDMRDDITLTPNTMVQPGGQADRTVAFELAFGYNEPVAAQAVAQDLMERIVELDAKGSAEQATNTVQFLTDQSKGLETKIAALQAQRSAISARNGAVLAGVVAVVLVPGRVAIDGVVDDAVVVVDRRPQPGLGKAVASVGLRAGQQLPGELNGAFLEVVAKGPVP